MEKNQLYMIHCGFYFDDKLYEAHTNIFVAAASRNEAKKKVKLRDDFKSKKMHIDSIQLIDEVDGLKVELL